MIELDTETKAKAISQVYFSYITYALNVHHTNLAG